MSDNKKSCIAFVAVIAIACLLAWLGGYDFARRGGDVAAMSAYALFGASLAALFVGRDIL